LRESGVLLPIGLGDGAEASEFFEGAFELFRLDGLEQVVDGIGFEGAEGVLIVCRGEDDEGLGGEAREEFEAVDAGHLDVDEEDVDSWFGGVEDGDGFGGVGGSAGDVDLRELGEEALEAFEGEGFVVDEVGAKGRGVGHCATSRVGMRMATVVVLSA
jgi:hypothetical protein